MLVLSRHQNERVIIGNREIIVTVVDFHHGQVRLGFEAPPETTIHREEVFLAIQRDGKREGGAPSA